MASAQITRPLPSSWVFRRRCHVVPRALHGVRAPRDRASGRGRVLESRLRRGALCATTSLNCTPSHRACIPTGIFACGCRWRLLCSGQLQEGGPHVRGCPLTRLECTPRKFTTCVCSQGGLQDGWPEGKGPQGAVRSSLGRDLVVSFCTTPQHRRDPHMSRALAVTTRDVGTRCFAVGSLCEQ